MLKSQLNREWYLLSCKPKQDQRAEENLNNQGYVTFRPTINQPKKRRGKEVLVNESLFPRYLFIHLDREQDNWAPIRSTFGVSGVVNFGQEPAKATDALIAQLRLRMEQGETSVNTKANQSFKVGQNVMIDDGPLKGLDAVFKGYTGEERVIVLLNLLSQQSKVTLPSSSVKKSLAV